MERESDIECDDCLTIMECESDTDSDCSADIEQQIKGY